MPSSVSAAAKAALVGAKTVKGPTPLSVPPRLAAVTAATSVLNSGASAAAVCTMFLSAGKITLSMTCTTPLLACTSVARIFEMRLRPSVMLKTPPAGVSILKMLFCKEVIFLPIGMPAFSTLAPSTWYVRTVVNSALSLSKASFVTPNSPSSAAKASLLGAKTVNGPAPDKVVAKSAATTASTKMLSEGVAFANSTMFGVGAGAALTGCTGSSSPPPHPASRTVEPAAAAIPVKISAFLRSMLNLQLG